MTLLITCATAEELSAFAPDLFPEAASIPEMQPIKAKFGNSSSIFLVSGTGPINASLAIGYTLGFAHHSNIDKITGLLCFGLAHSYNLQQAPLLSTWIVDREIWPEYGLNDGIRVTARAFSTPLWRKSESEEIYDTIEMADLSALAVPPNAKAYEWPKCPSLTLAGVTASFSRREELWNFWHIPLENMEGFAAGYASLRAGIPCVEIRIVGAKAGPRSKNEKDYPGALEIISSLAADLKLI